MRPCRHRCKNKEICKHTCCKVGVAIKDPEPAKDDIHDAPLIEPSPQALELPREMSGYETSDTMGYGKFGIVYKARLSSSVAHRGDNDPQFYAIKVVNLAKLQVNKVCHQLEREIEIQLAMSHPNILPLYTHFQDPTGEAHFMVLEFASGGDLYHFMRNQDTRCFEETRALGYIRQVCNALLYCHSHNVIHRDVKPDNIMCFPNDLVKLGDFGWSIRSDTRRTTLCGTLDYLSPEVVSNEPYSSAVDVWSVGILLFELVTGLPPFQAKTYAGTYKRILQVDYNVPHDRFTALGHNLLDRTLTRKNRATMGELVTILTPAKDRMDTE